MPRKAVNHTADQSDPDGTLINTIADFYADPLGFVFFAFPWGKPGKQLHDQGGPDTWQADILERIGKHVREGHSVQDAMTTALQIAVASGHGVGKTALVSWIILWFISTRPTPQIVVTANTKSQLETKTWRELAKWHKLAIHADWFQWTATKFYKKDRPEDWFAASIPWSKERAEAFAGTHEKHVLIIFDEASGIDDIIWETTEGAMTTPGAMWIAFGNPTQNTGRFREAFRKFRHRWITIQVDSRKAKMADKSKLDQWVDDYGEDSDFVRVRVRGVFPRAGTTQLIPLDLVEAAFKRRPKPNEYQHAAIVVSTDVARYGDDQTVIIVRQGRKIHYYEAYRELSTVQTAYRTIEAMDWCKEELERAPDGIFIDAVGVGAGVADTMVQLGYDIIEVNAGEKANDDAKFFNKRAEMWVDMRDWLKAGGALPNKNVQEITDDLTGPQYGFAKESKVQLEKKEDMKDRGLPSPDFGDALANSFYIDVESGAMLESLQSKIVQKVLDQVGSQGRTHMSR